MPWIALVCACVLGACSFEADYTGTLYCRSDDKCPSDLECREGMCRELRKDAAVDTPGDSMTDARQAALNCADPGVVEATGDSFEGSTASRSNTVSSMCSGSVMNGRDAVYRVDVGAGAMILVEIATGAQLAYVIAPCSLEPTTPMCLGGKAATAGDPISVTTTFAGQHFIVVDNSTVNVGGDYTLTVTVN